MSELKPITWHQECVGWSWCVGSLCLIFGLSITFGFAGMFLGLAAAAFAVCAIEIADPTSDDGGERNSSLTSQDGLK